ncbi:hypothetical protein [Streptomyces sp. DASNCL29]|uniref:hypothetical protein n=1 Tax=Streptomyces TaxID=1883 RepID=UPI00110F9340|nr:hypothetical protein [Streptomyces sp. DASNCL29]TMU90724.1 hypothetical protein FGK60_45320 [Streptomyces sp. DASNCL29]
MGQKDTGGNKHGSPKDKLGVGEDLGRFKKRVDQLLDDLDKSEASHKKMVGYKLTNTAFGSAEFPEAQTLATAYEIVHAQLELLSETLGQQLEAMGITVHMAEGDYKNIDQEEALRLQRIQKRTELYYEQYQKKKHPHEPSADDKKTGDGKGSGGAGG